MFTVPAMVWFVREIVGETEFREKFGVAVLETSFSDIGGLPLNGSQAVPTKFLFGFIAQQAPTSSKVHLSQMR